MSEWREYALSDIISIIGGGTPKTSNFEFWNGDIPWLSVVDFNNDSRYVYCTEKMITQKGLENSSTKILKKGQIIISARGTVGAIAQLGTDMAFNQSCYGIDSKALTNNDFIYYLLRYCVNNLQQQANGGVFDTIIRETFDNIMVVIPSIDEQKSIAEILSSLDDKIDLLRRQNKTLEALAETYFRQWFIEETNDDWESMPIQKIIDVRDGTHDSPKPADNGYYLITSKHLSENQIDFSSANKISYDDYIAINKRSKVDKYDILLSMIGTIGRLHLVTESNIKFAIKNVALYKTSEKELFCYYIYLYLRSKKGVEYINENMEGSTQQYVALGNLRSMEITIPSEECLKQFNKFITPLFKKIENNTTQINSTMALREKLLPKLMVGEIKIRDEDN